MNMALRGAKESQFLQMDQSEILTYRKQEYQYEVLVDHKEPDQKKKIPGHGRRSCNVR